MSGSWPATSTTRASAASPPRDIAVAHRLGYVVKLLAIAEQDASTDEVSVRVHPAMVPASHPLASVRESFNAVFIEGDAVGQLMLYGRGAGGLPTASAVLGDVIDAAVNLRKGTHGSLGAFAKASIRPIDETSAEYYLPLEVVDRPGVLHAVTGRVRPPRREHPHGGAGGPRRRRPPRVHHPPVARRPTSRRRCATFATSTRCSASGASCASSPAR